MNYRITCLTPTLAGDGQKLAPIDYMVWKDHVNVLDQSRIFKLLAKGPRLEGYLTQLKKADKLDFASWGGFAQNFADRRIPFEHPSSTTFWERTHTEHLFIPTFAAGPAGAYLPASTMKGALRTGCVFDRWNPRTMQEIAQRAEEERGTRRAIAKAEDYALGAGGSDRMRLVLAGDSRPVSAASFKVYLIRVSTLQARGTKLELGWKQSPRGAVEARKVDDSTPIFAEMAAPGTVFEGPWSERTYLTQPDIARTLNWSQSSSRARLFEAANRYAAALLTLHKEYAQSAGLATLLANLEQLEGLLKVAQERDACLLALGWGGGLLGKSAWLDTKEENWRNLMKQVPLYSRALQTGLPFPKTRRVVFLGNQPATLPGWTMLEVE